MFKYRLKNKVTGQLVDYSFFELKTMCKLYGCNVDDWRCLHSLINAYCDKFNHWQFEAIVRG